VSPSRSTVAALPRRLPTPHDVAIAAEALDGVVVRTPLERNAALSARFGIDVRLKLESKQVTGSFKVRGATAAVAKLEPDQLAVTASAGNHGLGVAFGCAQRGMVARIFVPATADRSTLERLRSFGPSIELVPNDISYDQAELDAHAFARAPGRHFISSYNDPDVIAGQGTIGLELLEQWPEVESVIVPVGGGGLLSGVALALHARRTEIGIFGVEPSASAAMTRSIEAGHIVAIDDGTTSLAEGLVGNLDRDSITFELVRRHAEKIFEVSEDEIAESVATLHDNSGIVAEPSGAIGLTVLRRVAAAGVNNVAVLITGSNITATSHRALLKRSASRAGERSDGLA
jgi:threonine dehydratase